MRDTAVEDTPKYIAKTRWLKAIVDCAGHSN